MPFEKEPNQTFSPVVPLIERDANVPYCWKEKLFSKERDESWKEMKRGIVFFSEVTRFSKDCAGTILETFFAIITGRGYLILFSYQISSLTLSLPYIIGNYFNSFEAVRILSFSKMNVNWLTIILMLK